MSVLGLDSCGLKSQLRELAKLVLRSSSRTELLAIALQRDKYRRERDELRRLLPESTSAILAASRETVRQVIEQIDPGSVAVESCWDDFSRGYFDEHLIKSFVKRIEGFTLASYDGLLELANEVRFCELNGIEGDYVEIGAYKGGGIGMMALCNMQYSQSRRTIHAFDSFEGLPQPVAKDLDAGFDTIFKLTDSQKQGKLEAINAVAAGEHYLREIVFDRVGYPEEKVPIYRGWFQDTIPVAAPSIDKIAILRLDGDLYESYMVPLTHLYDKVVPGGFVVIDDWIFQGCKQAIADFFGPRGGIPYLHHSDATVRVIRK